MDEATTRTVDLGSCVLEYYDSGSGDDDNRPVLLILGGVPSNLRDYEGILPRLSTSTKKFRVLALQWPGFGNSLLRLNATTFGGLPFFHQITLQFMRRLQLAKNTVLMGISTGAIVAVRIAVEFPSLVAKLVLVSPVGFASAEKHYAQAMSGKHYTSCGAAAREYLGNKDQPVVQAILQRCALLDDDDEANKVIRSVWRSVLLAESDMTAVGVVSNLRCNVFLVWGAAGDPVVDYRADGEAARQAIGEWVAGVKTVEGARHLVFAELPDEFLDAVLPFLEEEETWV